LYWVREYLPKKFFRISGRRRENLGILTQWCRTIFRVSRKFRLSNQQSREKKRVEKRARKYTSAILHALRVSAIFHPVVEMISSLGTVIVVALADGLH